MIYIALPFWLWIVVLTAWGVHRLWTGMVRPKIVNLALLPGTLVAQLGHVLGLLITGATVTNNSLYGDGESGEQQATKDPKTRLPFVGPVIVGMLPLLACGAGLYLTIEFLGRPFPTRLNIQPVGANLPTTLAEFWGLLRDLVTLVESFCNAVVRANFRDWRTFVFLYLFICLAIRSAPLPSNARGTLVAILVLGLGLAAVVGLLHVGESGLAVLWAIVNLTLAGLLFLGLISLVIRGLVGLVAVLRGREGSQAK